MTCLQRSQYSSHLCTARRAVFSYPWFGMGGRPFNRWGTLPAQYHFVSRSIQSRFEYTSRRLTFFDAGPSMLPMAPHLIWMPLHLWLVRFGHVSLLKERFSITFVHIPVGIVLCAPPIHRLSCGARIPHSAPLFAFRHAAIMLVNYTITSLGFFVTHLHSSVFWAQRPLGTESAYRTDRLRHEKSGHIPWPIVFLIVKSSRQRQASSQWLFVREYRGADTGRIRLQ